MKYLSDYTEEAIGAVLKECGAFFAFSSKQFDEQKQEGVDYVSIGSGTICPVDNIDKFLERIERVHKVGIACDIRDNGIREIIKRELINHECYYTGDPSDCVDKLSDYPTTKEQIIEVFRAEMPNHYDD